MKWLSCDCLIGPPIWPQESLLHKLTVPFSLHVFPSVPLGAGHCVQFTVHVAFTVRASNANTSPHTTCPIIWHSNSHTYSTYSIHPPTLGKWHNHVMSVYCKTARQNCCVSALTQTHCYKGAVKTPAHTHIHTYIVLYCICMTPLKLLQMSHFQPPHTSILYLWYLSSSIIHKHQLS